MRINRFIGFLSALATLSILPALLGCLMSERDGTDGRTRFQDSASVRLVLKPAVLMRSGAGPIPGLDSVLIRITGKDIAPLEFSFTGDSLAFTLAGLPVGSDRIISATIFKAGKALYAGSDTFSLSRETRTEVAIRCDPQFSRVSASFHLPLDVSPAIHSGLLKVIGTTGEYSAPLTIRDEFGYFKIEVLPGGTSYDVKMDLLDGQGKIRYQAERAGIFLPLGEEAKWDLNLLPSEVVAGFFVNLASPKEVSLEMNFPSRLRKPSQSGDLIVSEFYAAPGESDSLSRGEWFELFNRSADTLLLTGCRLSRDRTGGATKSYPFDSSQALPPGKTRVFGRQAAKADVHYSEFTMVNTASSLLFLCKGDSLVVDSLRYSSQASDSLSIPMKENWVTELHAGGFRQRESATAWCLSKPQGIGSDAASPGKVKLCKD